MKKDNQFEHQQRLEELWVDDETEKYNDHVMRVGMVIGGIGFLIGTLAYHCVFGVCLFLTSCLIDSGFTRD